MLRGFAATRAAPMGPDHSYGSARSVSSRRSFMHRRLDVSTARNAAQPSTPAPSSVGRIILGFLLVLLVLGVLPASFVLWCCVLLLVFTCLRLRSQAQTLQQALEQGELARSDSSDSLELMELGAGSAGAGRPLVRVIPGGGGLLLLHAEPRTALEQINRRLRQLDEEAGLPADFGPLARLDFAPGAFGHPGQGSRPPPVSDADISALPCYPYKPPRGSAPAQPDAAGAAAGAPFSPQPDRTSTAPAALPGDGAGGSEEQEGADAGAGTSAGASDTPVMGAVQQGQPAPGGPVSSRSLPAVGAAASAASPTTQASPAERRSRGGAAATDGDTGSSSSAAGASQPQQLQHAETPQSQQPQQPQGLTCPVCLDQVEEDAIVMTLPCLHQFHAACVTPWLRQQGLHASCPMCKTPVFR